VLLISDVRDWAFHQNMKDLERHLTNRFDFSHFFVVDFQTDGRLPNWDEYDAVFCVYHRWPIADYVPYEKTVGSLRAFWFFPETPVPPGPAAFALVNRYRAFHVVTKQNHDEIKKACPGAVYLTNPVDMTRFPEATSEHSRLIAEWNGNAKHRSGLGDIKGFYHIVRPACQHADVQLEVAEYNSSRLSPAEMPAFYRRANVGICASLYEGASNSLMEAMAAGLAIISSRTGNVVELHDSQVAQYGESGIILLRERTPEAIIEALLMLKKDMGRVKAMGAINREEIALRWSWPVWADRYASFLKRAL
jgi:hypothetical protein